MNKRESWHGTWTIARLNWPLYAAAVVGLLVSGSAVLLFTAWPIRLLAVLSFVLALYLLVGSLAVAHLIYDRSDLYRFGWLDRALGNLRPGKVVFCHTGFDDCSEGVRARLDTANWIVLDHFDPARMTERSIRRARKQYPPAPDTLPAAFDQWPAQAEHADVIFAVFAIHELRSDAERIAWFRDDLTPEKWT
jgi:hypothetical protein